MLGYHEWQRWQPATSFSGKFWGCCERRVPCSQSFHLENQKTKLFVPGKMKIEVRVCPRLRTASSVSWVTGGSEQGFPERDLQDVNSQEQWSQKRNKNSSLVCVWGTGHKMSVSCHSGFLTLFVSVGKLMQFVRECLKKEVPAKWKGIIKLFPECIVSCCKRSTVSLQCVNFPDLHVLNEWIQVWNVDPNFVTLNTFVRDQVDWFL